eukprot:1136764-Pelagomonas_calceolata.AAC.9
MTCWQLQHLEGGAEKHDKASMSTQATREEEVHGKASQTCWLLQHLEEGTERIMTKQACQYKQHKGKRSMAKQAKCAGGSSSLEKEQRGA